MEGPIVAKFGTEDGVDDEGERDASLDDVYWYFGDMLPKEAEAAAETDGKAAATGGEAAATGGEAAAAEGEAAAGGETEAAEEASGAAKAAAPPVYTWELVVAEDEEAGLCVAKREGPIEFVSDPNGGDMSFIATGQARKEGCSCLYGNPCQDKYICSNWCVGAWGGGGCEGGGGGGRAPPQS